jgi:hypothetical protein
MERFPRYALSIATRTTVTTMMATMTPSTRTSLASHLADTAHLHAVAVEIGQGLFEFPRDHPQAGD